MENGRVLFCASVLLLATGFGVPEALRAANPAGSAGTEATGLEQLLGVDDARHLLHRTGIGATPADTRKLQTLTRRQAVEHILAQLRTEPVVPMPSWVNAAAPHYWARGDMTPAEQTRFDYARDAEVAELRRWWVREMIETDSPQTEKLVLFWSSHFATAYSGLDQESTSVARQNQRFRQLGAGNYRILLKAMLRDAGLLRYLDNQSSTRSAPNENLGREFLELYTLGEGQFGESMVREAARALTGWRVSPAANMAFQFNRWHHDPGLKQLFGERGRFDGDDLVDIALAQPQASLHLAAHFYQYYISPHHAESTEAASVIDDLARQFRAHDYSLVELLRATWLHPAFWVQSNRAAMIKSPVDLLLGSIRSSGMLPAAWETLPAHLGAAGQNLFDPPNVAGWPGHTAWVTASQLLSRRLSLESLFTQPATVDPLPHRLVPVYTRLEPPDVQAPVRTISIRLAAEDYQGPPLFQVELLSNGDSVWRSRQLAASGGLDTERFGRAESRDRLPWQTIRFEAESVPARFDAVKVSFLNDAAGDTGDRNLYIDSVGLDDQLYTASRGRQSGDCPPDNPARAGNLYCAGSVTIADPPRLTQAHDATGRDLQVDPPRLWWMQAPGTGGWQELVIGLTGVTLGVRHWHSLVLHVVQSEDNGLGLQIKSTGCYPHCVQRWPDCAWKTGGKADGSGIDSNTQRSVFIPLATAEKPALACHWNQLSDDDRQLVGSLVHLLPSILDAAGKGARAAKDPDAFTAWVELVENAGTSLSRTDYASHGTKARLLVREPAHSGGVVDAQAALVEDAINLAGKWDFELREDVQRAARVLLSVPPAGGLPAGATLLDVLRNPAINLY